VDLGEHRRPRTVGSWLSVTGSGRIAIAGLFDDLVGGSNRYLDISRSPCSSTAAESIEHRNQIGRHAIIVDPLLSL
jgi:hypothetical protein